MSKLYFNFAAMNAGKSTILLQASHNYRERGMKTLLLKPEIDTRDTEDRAIISRIGLKAQAELFSPECDLGARILALTDGGKVDCVFIDEAQFLTKDQVWQLAALSDERKIPILCYGLRTDFRGELFPGSAALLAIADSLNEIRTLCWCGRKATMNLRVDAQGMVQSEGAQVEIGGNDRYVSLCRKHWRANAHSSASADKIGAEKSKAS